MSEVGRTFTCPAAKKTPKIFSRSSGANSVSDPVVGSKFLFSDVARR